MSTLEQPTVLTEFTDPRLVAIYDTVNPYDPGTQPDFYGVLARDFGRAKVIDFGCGTGLISCELARQGHTVVGVDPAPAMIEAARAKACDGVRWIVGGAENIGQIDADMAFMSGHVAQFFLTDAAWDHALLHLKAALRPGGVLAFESRNPEVRAWERWTADRRTTVIDPKAGTIECWSEVREVKGEVVFYENHYLFRATGEALVAPAALRFRPKAALVDSLQRAGFAVEAIFGDWQRRTMTRTSGEMILVARG